MKAEDIKKLVVLKITVDHRPVTVVPLNYFATDFLILKEIVIFGSNITTVELSAPVSVIFISL